MSMILNKTQHLSNKIFNHDIKTLATRDGFGDGVLTAGENNENVMVLTGDLAGSTKVEKFAETFPERFYNVGISEQNMAGIAAGLALSGKIPFMTSFAVFSPGRNWDQIRVSICYSEANVKIIGSHAGFSNEGDGATAQALEDIALTRVLPNMVVISPADYLETKKATVEAAKHKGPVYIRLMRIKTPSFTTEKTPFKIGKAQILSEGEDITIISTGPIVHDALLAAKEAYDKHKISCEVINCSTIKPLDEATILKSVKKTGRVITVEEHQIAGGLGSAVSEFLSQQNPVPITFIGVDNKFGESGEYISLKNKFGLGVNRILETIKSNK
jgi:transketolase